MARKTKLISIRLNQALYAEASRAARLENRSLGDWIRLRLLEVLAVTDRQSNKEQVSA
jgi:hypothetical protein